MLIRFVKLKEELKNYKNFMFKKFLKNHVKSRNRATNLRQKKINEKDFFFFVLFSKM